MRIGWVSGWMRVREYRWKKGRRRKQQQPKQDLHLIQFEFTILFLHFIKMTVKGGFGKYIQLD